jgi:DNA-binding transcriptional LysR family regulator
MSKSVISHHIALLERAAGAKLLARTGRGVRLTDTGEVLAVHGRAVAQSAREALADARAAEQPRGTLRLSMPAGIMDAKIVPMLTGFLRTYPGIDLDIVATDTVIDIAAERVDVAFRFGRIEDGRTVARRLTTSDEIVVATPAYLASAPAVERLSDLAQHAWVGFGAFGRRHVVSASSPDGTLEEVEVGNRVTTTSGLAIKHWVLAGAGIARFPRIALEAELASGQLVRLLSAWDFGVQHLFAVYLPERHRPANVRRLMDFARNHFRGSGATGDVDESVRVAAADDRRT